MKRILAVFLLLTLLTGCAQTQNPVAEPVSQVAGLPVTFGSTYTDCDCSCLQLKGTDYAWEDDSLRLNIDWINQTLDEGVFGVDFTLEQWKNGSWVPCQTKNDVFIEIACILSAGQVRPEVYPITDHYALTEPGEYRLGATCYMNERATQVWLEFGVGEVEKLPEPEQGNAQYTKLPVKTQYVRTDGGWDGRTFPQVCVIPSREYLENYYENNKDSFYLERQEQAYSDTTIGFLDACDQYDGAFFEENYLVFVILQEPSGSISHEITQVLYTGFEQLSISVERELPECGTDDMAAWHLILEISRDYAVAETDVLLYLDGTLRLGEPPELDPGIFMRTKPPKMQLRNSEGSYDIQMGSYHWDYLAGEDTRSSVIADANHPLCCFGEPFTLTDGKVELLFEEQPDDITVDCWPESALEDENAENILLNMDGNSLQLLPGGYIYHVHAKWEEGKRDYFGSADYSFYAVLQEPHEHTAGQPHTSTGTQVTCGNTVATVFGDRESWAFSLTGDDAVILTQLLLDLPYSEETCRCMAEHFIKTEFGAFEVNLTQGFARGEKGQAQLTAEELETVTGIIAQAKENAQKEG